MESLNHTINLVHFNPCPVKKTAVKVISRETLLAVKDSIRAAALRHEGRAPADESQHERDIQLLHSLSDHLIQNVIPNIQDPGMISSHSNGSFEDDAATQDPIRPLVASLLSEPQDTSILIVRSKKKKHVTTITPVSSPTESIAPKSAKPQNAQVHQVPQRVVVPISFAPDLITKTSPSTKKIMTVTAAGLYEQLSRSQFSYHQKLIRFFSFDNQDSTVLSTTEVNSVERSEEESEATKSSDTACSAAGVEQADKPAALPWPKSSGPLKWSSINEETGDLEDEDYVAKKGNDDTLTPIQPGRNSLFSSSKRISPDERKVLFDEAALQEALVPFSLSGGSTPLPQRPLMPSIPPEVTHSEPNSADLDLDISKQLVFETYNRLDNNINGASGVNFLISSEGLNVNSPPFTPKDLLYPPSPEKIQKNTVPKYDVDERGCYYYYDALHPQQPFSKPVHCSKRRMPSAEVENKQKVMAVEFNLLDLKKKNEAFNRLIHPRRKTSAQKNNFKEEKCPSLLAKLMSNTSSLKVEAATEKKVMTEVDGAPTDNTSVDNVKEKVMSRIQGPVTVVADRKGLNFVPVRCGSGKEVAAQDGSHAATEKKSFSDALIKNLAVQGSNEEGQGQRNPVSPLLLLPPALENALLKDALRVYRGYYHERRERSKRDRMKKAIQMLNKVPEPKTVRPDVREPSVRKKKRDRQATRMRQVSNTKGGVGFRALRLALRRSQEQQEKSNESVSAEVFLNALLKFHAFERQGETEKDLNMDEREKDMALAKYYDLAPESLIFFLPERTPQRCRTPDPRCDSTNKQWDDSLRAWRAMLREIEKTPQDQATNTLEQDGKHSLGRYVSEVMAFDSLDRD